MGLFGELFHHDDARRHNEYVYGMEPEKHEGSLGHEVIAGAAGFAAMKAYEDHLRATGAEPSHALMKELLAGFAAAEVDKLVETKGLDYIDREKAKRHAAEQAHHLAAQKYGEYNAGTDWMRNNGGYAPQYDPHRWEYRREEHQFDRQMDRDERRVEHEMRREDRREERWEEREEHHHHHHHGY